MKTQGTQQLPVKTTNNNSGSLHKGVFGDLYAKHRSNISFFGYHDSVLKSAIQKYARRAELEKGLWCLVEMDLFSLLECDGPLLNAYLRKYQERTRVLTKRAAKTPRSNMVNRLVAMVSEEVNISAWWMPAKILELYEKWHLNRGNVFSRKYLVDMYKYLTSNKMIRLISDLKSVFLLPPYYVEPDQMNDLMRIHCKIRKQYPKIYTDQTKVGHVTWTVNVDRYPIKLQPCIKGIIYNLEIGSDNVFYWIHKWCEFERKDWIVNDNGKNIFNYKCKYLKMVWEILHRFIDRNREYEIVRDQIFALQEFFKKMGHKEKPIYLHHAVLLLVRRKEIDWSSTAPSIDTPIADVDRLYRDHLVGGKMPMDDYIYDLHTKGGKRSGNCMENFALEGAYIENENASFLRPEYREIYVKLKQELDLYRSRGGRLQ